MGGMLALPFGTSLWGVGAGQLVHFEYSNRIEGR